MSDDDAANEGPHNRLSDREYLEQIERLAQVVCDAAFEDRGADIWHPEKSRNSLDRAISELAVSLRVVHREDDGCLDPE
jgi:hypothetical protein